VTKKRGLSCSRSKNTKTDLLLTMTLSHRLVPSPIKNSIYSSITKYYSTRPSQSVNSFRKKHERHSNSSTSKYYERKLHLKEKMHQRKQIVQTKRKHSIESEANQLLNNLYSSRPHRESAAPSSDHDNNPSQKLSRSQIAERKKKLHRYKETMKRKSNTQYSIRHPNADASSEIPMPNTMHQKFIKDYIENGVQKWVSPSERTAKFAETIALLQSKNLTPHRAIRIFDRKIKKYSLHLPLPDYLNLLIPLVRNGYVEKTFEIYSRMKHFDNLLITPKVITTVMHSLSEATPENERVVAITDDNLLVLKSRQQPLSSSEQPSDDQTTDSASLPQHKKDLFSEDPDLNPHAHKAKKQRDSVDHVACIARAHELLNKDCLQYNIPLQTPILTEFIRVLGMHGLPKKAFIIFHKMLANTKLHNLSHQAHTEDTTMELNDENMDMLSSLVHELGDEAEDEVLDALEKAKGAKGDATKKKMVEIDGQPHLVPDKYTYGVIIEALSQNGEIGKVLKLFEEIPRVYKRIPVYNALFAALSKCRDQFETKMLSEQGKIPDFSKTVLQYYQELMKLRLHPTKHTFSLILQCIPERCYDVLREMRVQKVEPDLLLEGQLLNEMIEHGFWKQTMEELLPQIPVGSIPNGVMYQLFQKIVVSKNLQDVEEMEPFLKFMRESGLKDLKLDPKLKVFLMQKKKHRLLKGLEEYVQRGFTAKYDPQKIAAHQEARKSEQNLDRYRHDHTDDDESDQLQYDVPALSDPFNENIRRHRDSREVSERDEEKPVRRNVLRLNTSNVLSSLQHKRKKIQEQV